MKIVFVSNAKCKDDRYHILSEIQPNHSDLINEGGCFFYVIEGASPREKGVLVRRECRIQDSCQKLWIYIDII